MTDLENAEWGDLVSIKYNSGISGVREAKTGVVLEVKYGNPPRVSDMPAPQSTSISFHPINVSTVKAPIYMAHFGEGVASLVEKSEKRMYANEAANWVQGDTVDDPLLKWAAVSSPENPELVVSVFPSIRNRVYSDLDQ